MISSTSEPGVRGVVFDKDGTLLDFGATWNPALAATFAELFDDRMQARAAGAAIGFDVASGHAVPNGPVVHASNDELAALLAPFIDAGHFATRLMQHSMQSVTAAPFANEVLAALSARSVPLAIATNDDAGIAKTQMELLGWGQYFSAFLGQDSGFGAKPAPGMVTAAATQLGLHPTEVAMVGDSSTDLEAGRAAGALAVLVGNDPTLVALADVVVVDLRSVVDLVANFGGRPPG